jgi:hypothetical protein
VPRWEPSEVSKDVLGVIGSPRDDLAQGSPWAGEHLAAEGGPLGVPRSLFPYIGGGEQGNGGYTRSPGEHLGNT